MTHAAFSSLYAVFHLLYSSSRIPFISFKLHAANVQMALKSSGYVFQVLQATVHWVIIALVCLII